MSDLRSSTGVVAKVNVSSVLDQQFYHAVAAKTQKLLLLYSTITNTQIIEFYY